MKYDFNELANIVQKVKDGDDQAFITLYEKTYQQTYFLAHSMLKNKENAQDAVQEVFTNVHLNLSKLQSNKTFIAWINRITYNICLRMCEQNKITCLDDSHLDDLPDSQNEHNPLAMSILKSQKEVLSELINELDEPLKVTILLKYYEDLKIKDIAKIMSCPEGTVKSRLTTAKRVLKNQIVKGRKSSILLPYFAILPTRNALSLCAQQNSMDPVFASELITSSIGVTAISDSINFTPSKPNPAVSALHGLFASVVAGGTIITTTSAVTLMALSPTLSDATIITPLEGYTNQPVTVSVGIEGSTNLISKLYASNGSEQILTPITISEGDALFSLSENGQYIFYLDGKDNTTGTAEMVITCIDTEPPTIEDYFLDNNILTITFGDDLSGVNISTAYGLDANEKKILPYESQNHSIKFELLPTQQDFKLCIADMSGNVSRYNIAIKHK